MGTYDSKKLNEIKTAVAFNAAVNAIIDKLKKDQDDTLRKMSYEVLKKLDEKPIEKIYSCILKFKSEEGSILNNWITGPGYIRGLNARARLLKSDGGVISVSDVAKLLNLTRQSVDLRRKQNKLLAVLFAGRNDYFYPVWQFDENGIKKNFVEVLSALEPVDQWTKMIFWLSGNVYLKGERPIDALKDEKKIDQIIRAAIMIGEQGGQ